MDTVTRGGGGRRIGSPMAIALALLGSALLATPLARAIPVEDVVVVVGFTGTDLADVITDADLGPGQLQALADAVGFDTPLGGLGEDNVSVTASAETTGVDAKADGDQIDRTISTLANADASATGGTVDGSLAGAASVRADVDATANSAGLIGGEGDDVINSGDDAALISPVSTADATGVGVTIAIDGNVVGDATSPFALNQATTIASATSLGIDGGSGGDTITNQVSMVGHATTNAVGVGVGLSIGGGSEATVGVLSDASVLAHSRTVGITGGEGADDIDNSGVLSLLADADATAVSVSLDVAGSLQGDAASGGALSDSSAMSDAELVGLSGGGGDDNIVNSGLVVGNSTAVARSIGVSVDITIGADGVASGGSLSDAGVTATSITQAMDGGDGMDTLTNTGLLSLGAFADSTAVAVSVDLAGTMVGGADGSASSNSAAVADSTTIGISGGADNDVVVNRADGQINALAVAEATAVSVGLTVAGQVRVDDQEGTQGEPPPGGDVSGAVVSDSRVFVGAHALGIAGGDGLDQITNDAELFPTAVATGEAVAVAVGESVNVGVNVVPEGDVAGLGLSDASVTASSTAYGINAGEDGDIVVNRGNVSPNSIAGATGVAVGVTVAGKVAYQQPDDEGGESAGAPGDAAAGGDVTSQAFSNARADALAVGSAVAGAGGADNIDNSGALTVFVDSDALAVAAAVDLDFGVGINVAPQGDVSGAALSNAGVAADALASGIDAGSGDDVVGNSGTMVLVSDANAVGIAASLSVSGNVAYKGEGTEDGDVTPDSVTGQALSDASANADARTVGIDVGLGDDTVVNQGMLPFIASTSTATGVAAALNIAAGAGIESDIALDVSGAAVSDSSVGARASTIGIDGGAGNDSLTNSAAIVALQSDASAVGVAAALDISGSLSFKGDVSGSVAGEALSDSSTSAEAQSTAVAGGQGDDDVANEAAITLVRAASDATGVAAALGIEAAAAVKGDAEDVTISGRAMTDASVTASATAMGLDGGAGSDQISNSQSLGIIVATSDATGVAASLDIAGSFSYKGDTDASVSGQAVSDTSVAAKSSAVAIGGGDGTDRIVNHGDIASVFADSEATGIAASLSAAVGVTVQGDSKVDVEGRALSKADVSADAVAIGIGGGAGDDEIINTGDLQNVESVANTIGVAAGLGVTASVTVKGNSEADVTGEALSDNSVRAAAGSWGVSGDAGNDQVDNEGSINVLAGSDALGVAASVEVAAAVTFKGTQDADVSGTALSDTRVTAVSQATGIDGGSGEDTLNNVGAITLMAGSEPDANALGVAASLTVSGNLAIKGIATGEAGAVAGSNSTVTAGAVATGIQGGADADTISNTGAIVALPAVDATGISASLTVSGSMTGEATGSAMSEAVVTAQALATGIDGGAGDDSIVNEGSIALMNDGSVDEADAEALAVSVTLEITGTAAGEAEGEALSNAKTIADAHAAGIDGSAGADRISNSGAILAEVESEADAVSVGASITVTGNGTAEGAAITDASAIASASARGIAGGADDDTVDNEGTITLSSDADASATAVSVALTGSARGVAQGKAVADGSADAAAQSIGLDGGSGSDAITASGPSIIVHAQSSASSHSVSVNVTGSMGVADGASVADGSANSDAYAAGLDGGAGVDTISNDSAIVATAASGADASSTTVGVTFSAGSAQSVGTADSSATARAIAVGVEGGDDADTITNTAVIFAGGVAGPVPMARATASTTDVTVGIGAGYSNSDSSANSASLAEADAIGLSGGAGDDVIENSGAITAGPAFPGAGMAHADADSDAVKVDITVGVSANQTASDSSANAVANAVGVSGGAGNDRIENSGLLAVGQDDALAVAAADSRSVRVGITLGASLGETSSNSSANATANVSGIAGDAGSDQVINTGVINVGKAPTPGVGGSMALATAGSDSVDVGITLGASLQDVSANASANATSIAAGIAGGENADVIDNSGVITAFSSAETISSGDATKVSLSIGASGGGAASDASSVSLAQASGIDGGGGADDIASDSDLNVGAWSTSTAESTADDYNILSLGAARQSAESNSSATARAIGRGVYGGAGADLIVVGDALTPGSATVTVVAQSNVASIARSSSVTGFALGAVDQKAKSNAESIAHALAIGIDGGEGDDDVVGAAQMNVNAVADAQTTGVAATSTGFTLGGVARGESVSDARTTVTAEAIGMRGGLESTGETESDANNLLNVAPIHVTATAAGSSSSMASAESPLTVFGSAEGKAVADASAEVLARAVGLQGGAGSDVITNAADELNRGALDVRTDAIASVASLASGDADVVFGDASTMGVADASASIAAESLGLTGGAGDDVITNQGSAFVAAVATGDIDATADINADVTFGAASSGAITDASARKFASATGIDGGIGADTIANFGLLAVDTETGGSVTSRSRASSDSFFSSASSNAVSAAALESTNTSAGVLGGADDDTIVNLGSIGVNSGAVLKVASLSVATAESTFSSASASAVSAAAATGSGESLGISGDAGNDVIDNQGVLDVTATGSTEVVSASIAIARSTFGGESTAAATSTSAAGAALARGIAGGDGDDTIVSDGIVNVAAGSDVTVVQVTYSSDGPAVADARSIARANAEGIAGDSGSDAITNSGALLVSARPRVLAATRNQGDLVAGAFGVVLAGTGSGIAGGDGDDVLVNSGDVVVVVGRESASAISARSDTGSSILQDDNRVGTDAADLIGRWVRIELDGATDHYTTIVGFDPVTGEMVLNDPLPQTLLAGTDYVVLDLPDGVADIGVTTLNVGGLVLVDGSATAEVLVAGMSGGAGFDEVVNELGGDVRAAGSNSIQVGNFEIAAFAQADLRTSTEVQAVALAGEAVTNLGLAGAQADANLRADGAQLTLLGATVDQTGSALATAWGVLGDETLANSVNNSGSLEVHSKAEIRAIDRVFALFSGGDQQLEFESASVANGIELGAGDDIVVNNGSLNVEGQALGSIQGVNVSRRLFNIGLRSENVVDARVDATAFGVDLGAGSDAFDNAGSVIVAARAAPSSAAEVGTQCGAEACLAFARSDVVRNETSASADAEAAAVARGIRGQGDDRISSSGSLIVVAEALATSFAQAGTIVAAQDQSRVSELGGAADTFIDASLQGVAESELLGKRLRFPDALDLDFFEAASIVESLDLGDAPRTFTDTSYSGANPVGMRIRFEDDDAGLVSVVTAFDAVTGEFTLEDDIPAAVADAQATGDYTLSVLTAEVIAFESATGRITLSNDLPPAGVNPGDRYSLSIVSTVVGSTSFQDVTRIGESVPIGTLVTFVGESTFSAVVTDFDASNGTFELSQAIPQNVARYDVYTLASDVSEGQSGADAQAFATGIDLANGNVEIVSDGLIDVLAQANADTRAVAVGTGVAPAAANAVAEARGVKTGSGDDVIEINGTLNVAANVVATSTTTSITDRVLAIGIESGDGDDVLINRGQILVAASTSGSGPVRVMGIDSGSGDDAVLNFGALESANPEFIAIDTGDGSDAVRFGAESLTVGPVLLGEGDDTLIFEGGGLVTLFGGAPGVLEAGLGTDLLMLEGAGAFVGSLGSFEQLSKQRPGTFTLSALPTLELLSIQEGVVRVDDAYDFSNSGIFEVPIAGDGSHGQLSVAGAVSLDGLLDVTRGVGPYFDGTTFDLVVADGGIAVGSTYGTIELPEPTALVDFSYRQSADVAWIVANVEAFSAFALDPIQRGVAEHLDRLLPIASGDLSFLLNHLQLLSANELPPSYTALSPMQFAVTRQLFLDAAGQHLRSMQHRMSSLRVEGLVGSAGHRGSYAEIMPVLLASTGSPPATAGAAQRKSSRYGLWVDLYGANGGRDADDGYAGYDVDGYGVTVGFDAALSPSFLLGLSVGQAGTDVNFDASTGGSELDTTFVALYGSWITKRSYLDAIFLYGKGDQDDERPVPIAGLPRFAISDHDVTTTGFSLDGAYNFGGRNWAWGPFAALRYTKLDEDGFTETGAMDTSLIMASNESEALQSNLGFRMWRAMSRKQGELVPEFSVAWVHDFDIGDSSVNAEFLGAPGLRFSIPAQSVEEDGIRLAIGLGYVSRRGVSTLLRYAAEYRGDFEWQGLQGQLRYEF